MTYNTRKLSKRRAAAHRRRGTAIIEGMVVLSTLLMVLFVLFDLGLAAFQYNTLSAAARYTARCASIHGSAASPQLSAWGPTEYSGNAGDGTEIATVAASLMASMAKSDVSIDVQWPNGTNSENDTVQVTLKYTHKSLLPFLPGINSLALQAQSTMSIVH